MIKYAIHISKKDEKLLDFLLQDIMDEFRDFYITKENLRLFIKDNKHLLFESLKRGDKIAFSEEDGIAFIVGKSDKALRLYLKILARNNESANRLLKVINWNVREELWCKIKKNNSLIKVLEKNGFVFKGNRGREVLLHRRNFT